MKNPKEKNGQVSYARRKIRESDLVNEASEEGSGPVYKSTWAKDLEASLSASASSSVKDCWMEKTDESFQAGGKTYPLKMKL